MPRITLSLLVATLLCAACTAAPNADTPGDVIRAPYQCDNGESIEVRYFPAQGVAVLVRHDKPLELQQQRTASGFHYSNGPYSIRGKGSALTLEVGRMAPIQCHEQRP